MTTTMPTRIALLCTLVLMLLGSSRAVAASHTSFPGVDDSGQSSALKKKEKEKKEKPDKGKDKVVPLEEYTVAVSCVPADSDASSECTFIADGPKGKGKVKVLYVPTASECLDGASSDAAKATVEDGSAFASRKNQPSVKVSVPRTVSVGGTATYWLEADKHLVPAQGPGLICSTPEPESSDSNPPTAEPGKEETTPEPTATPEAITTGNLRVIVQSCPDGMKGEEYDWYGACDQEESSLRFQLRSVDNENTALTSASDVEGVAAFANLEPGTYSLKLVDQTWCHAESDSVNAEGQVEITAGETASVWIFTCEDSSGS